MKTSLRPCILDFLKKRGYKYFLSKQLFRYEQGSRSSIVLIPVFSKPALQKPFIGFEDCFSIPKDLSTSELCRSENTIKVLLSSQDILHLKRHLISLFPVQNQQSL